MSTSQVEACSSSTVTLAWHPPAENGGAPVQEFSLEMDKGAALGTNTSGAKNSFWPVYNGDTCRCAEPYPSLLPIESIISACDA